MVAGCATLFLVFSCRGWLDADYPFGQPRSSLALGDGHKAEKQQSQEQPDEEGEHTPHCYLSAVEFSQGYNWKRDSAGGQVPCRIVLFRDGERVLELPVGENGPSADPDMHRIAGGHLYTDFSTEEGETLIARDGIELFRYPGRESIRGFFVSPEGRVHTLGQNRLGQGFSYRIDGEEVFARSTGTLLGGGGSGPLLRSGALSRDGDGGVCFTFGTGAGHWWIWSEGKIREVPLEGLKTLYDLRPVRGSPVAVLRRDLFGVLRPDGSFGSLAVKEPLSAQIVPDGSGLADYRIALRQRQNNGNEVDSWYAPNGNGLHFAAYGGHVEHVLLEGQDCYVAMDRSGKVAEIRGKDREAEKVEAGRYLLISPSCIWMSGEENFVALSGDPDLGAAPQLWHNGEWLSLLLCGYLTGVSYE